MLPQVVGALLVFLVVESVLEDALRSRRDQPGETAVANGPSVENAPLCSADGSRAVDLNAVVGVEKGFVFVLKALDCPSEVNENGAATGVEGLAVALLEGSDNGILEGVADGVFLLHTGDSLAILESAVDLLPVRAEALVPV